MFPLIHTSWWFTILFQIITTITERFTTQLRLEEMKLFFEKHPEAGAGQQYRKIALETVENNIKFLESHSKDIYSWLKDNPI